jgi:hypothetical protein
MDFLFKAPSAEEVRNLAQGDIIRKTDAVSGVLKQAHAYYADNEEYFAFIVLTQSCDLVRRSKGAFKAPYITIAAMKRARVALREFEPGFFKTADNNPVSIVAKAQSRRVQQIIERLIHNTYDDYFFVPSSDLCQLPEPCIAYLRLSVALRKTHYDILLESRVGQLNDVFRAKLGWLAGNIYSRVATPDIEDSLQDGEQVKQEIIRSHMPEDMVELAGFQSEEFKKKLRQIKGEITKDIVAQLLTEIPQEIDIVAERVIKRLMDKQIIENNDELKERLFRALVNEPTLKQLIGRN